MDVLVILHLQSKLEVDLQSDSYMQFNIPISILVVMPQLPDNSYNKLPRKSWIKPPYLERLRFSNELPSKLSFTTPIKRSQETNHLVCPTSTAPKLLIVASSCELIRLISSLSKWKILFDCYTSSTTIFNFFFLVK